MSGFKSGWHDEYKLYPADIEVTHPDGDIPELAREALSRVVLKAKAEQSNPFGKCPLAVQHAVDCDMDDDCSCGARHE